MTKKEAASAKQIVDEFLSRTQIHGREMTCADLDAYYRSGWEKIGGQVVEPTLGYWDAAALVSSFQYWLEADRLEGRSNEATLLEYKRELRRAASFSRQLD